MNPVTIAPMLSTNSCPQQKPRMPSTSETIASGEVFWRHSVPTGSAGAGRIPGRRLAA